MRVLKRAFSGLLALGAIAGLLFSVTRFGMAQEANRHRASASTTSAGTPIAVVELFTSEGCSSCPPADEILRGISDENIFPLSFHVDYWNRLGWRDPFSDASFSNRQRRYARVFNSGRVYTPQAIINGRHGLVGSRQRALEAQIQQALQEPTTKVEVSVEQQGRTLEIHHRVEGLPQGYRLQLALAESGLSRRVRRGENRGRTLRHDHVVRAITTRPLNGDSRMTVPSDVVIAQTSLVAFAQHEDTMLIAGAARVALTGDP